MEDKEKFVWIAAGILMAHAGPQEILELKTPLELRTSLELRGELRVMPIRRHEAVIPDHGPHAESRGLTMTYTQMAMATTSTGMLTGRIPTNLTFFFPGR